MSPLIQLRPAQKAVFRHSAGILGHVWRRQYGKSYVLASGATDVMLSAPNLTNVFMSAAIRLGQENLRGITNIWRTSVTNLRLSGQHVTTNVDDDDGNILDADAVDDMIESNKLEIRAYHDRTNYSRAIVIAPNPDTAVGYTGYLWLDEVGRMPMFRDVWEAAEPFAASNPDFKIRLATTPPPDDSHYSYELLAPAHDEEFPVNPEGNFYRSEAGVLIHRVDAWDAAAAGTPIYDSETREPLTPDESLAKAWDKTAWWRNFGCQFLRNTGQSAITSVDLNHAQARGAEEGVAIALFDSLPESASGIDSLLRSYLPLDWTLKLKGGPLGMGLDLATSDKKTSNPSSLTVSEKLSDVYTRLVIAFKSRDEAITTRIVELIIEDLMRVGRRPRGLAIDASNEIFFAQGVRKNLLGKVRVHLIKSGENLLYQGEETSAKIVLGNLYANAFLDGTITLPAGKWLAEDHRLVRRVKGSFDASVLSDGRHADTFDSGKLAHWVLEGSISDPAEAEAISISSQKPPRSGLKNPYAHLHESRGQRLGF